MLTDRIEPGLLTAGEVIALGRHPHTGWRGVLEETDRRAARQAAELVGVASLWDRPFAELSDGQRQRVFVARALAQEPTLLVLDEPTAFLDAPARVTLTATLTSLARRTGVTVLMSSHDLDLALAHADSVWLVDEATVHVAAPEDLLLHGQLHEAFAGEEIEIDPVTGTMTARTPPGHPVVISGDGVAAALAARAARRAGAEVVDTTTNTKQPWQVDVSSTGWRFTCHDHTHDVGNLGELARTIRQHLNHDQPETTLEQEDIMTNDDHTRSPVMSGDPDRGRPRDGVAVTEPQRVEVPGNGTFDLWELPTDETFLFELLERVFTSWWPSIRFGVLVPGAAWEVAAPNPPTKISMLDGYITIDFGTWHFHLCIGPFVGDPDDPLPEELARARRTGRAELGRRIGSTNTPTSWFLRLTTNAGDQQLTVLLPNPLLDDAQRIIDPPDWSRLAAWDELRRDCLDIGPDPIDRTGTGFGHEA